MSNLKAHDGEVVIGCDDLDASVAFYRRELGFRIDSIYPADSPRVTCMSRGSLAIRLDQARERAPVVLHIAVEPPPESGAAVTAPEGTRIEFDSAETLPVIPGNQPEFVVCRLGAASAWGAGRAGMLYRDLIPQRQGGRFIASHIRIPDGGPVPDYVHYHEIRFQMIYCYRGWVRLVYEDQGPPFVMRAGECVLQPPMIRHRVLACSNGLEVLEIGCPAEHITRVEHAFDLPTHTVDAQRDFSGQRFVFHELATATWQKDWNGVLSSRDLGIARATGGLASVRVLRAMHAVEAPARRFGGEFLFLFVLEGEMTVSPERQEAARLCAGDSCVIPDGMNYAAALTANSEVLEVLLPASAAEQAV